MNNHLKTIIIEMFFRVGVEKEAAEETITNGFLEEPSWYTLYEWTLEEQEDFENWFVDYLYKNKEARDSICEISRRNKKHLKKVAKEFTLMYGWKLKD